METLIHYIARAPFKRGHLKSNWAWRDDDLPPAPEPELLDEIRRRRNKSQQRSTQNSNSSQNNDHREPLLGGSSNRGVSFS